MTLAAAGTLNGEAGAAALLVVLLLGVVTVLLIRNMSKRIKRLPTTFRPPPDKPSEPAEPPADDPTDTGRQ